MSKKSDMADFFLDATDGVGCFEQVKTNWRDNARSYLINTSKLICTKVSQKYVDPYSFELAAILQASSGSSVPDVRRSTG